MQLTPRLNKIANEIEKQSKVADIGTDHGYLPIYLVQKQISSFVIASDVNKGPLQTAEINAKKYKCQDSISIRQGSGLETLTTGEVDTIIIAGMGGILISELLEANPQITKSIVKFILQPMQAQDVLRRYLVQNNYKIDKDILIKEDEKIYEVIVASEGIQHVEKEIFYDIGFHIEDNNIELAIEFVERKIQKESRILTQIKSSKTSENNNIYEKSMRKLHSLKEVKAWLQSKK
ncbi:class I SAM-dependent methyltransferase [Serpentinicella sp. ANB-PHB4]|uniref:tRNA (adenine(22)-N(1))-methyltransferase n=1 Tax=Serpentinicella sp. ANB-PHB4 TaxID=3074076 RepID=UPI0028553E47|nr:class I SAM-dependent methyltransferase [Serpentinicella sp. ANB-PHB4]MDR5658001.1 class I SAM-dependent methyltransferase [Serpentinicella sp. ANB-PHB4]